MRSPTSGVLVVELADEFLDDVLEGDQAEDLAVFCPPRSRDAAGSPGRTGSASRAACGRHEIGRGQEVADAVHAEIFSSVLPSRLALVQHADHVLAVAVDRQPGVEAGGDLAAVADDVPGRTGRCLDRAARRHHVPTVMLSRSKRLSRMLRCLCGMYWPDSITIARNLRRTAPAGSSFVLQTQQAGAARARTG